jgi:hypothetical protein
MTHAQAQELIHVFNELLILISIEGVIFAVLLLSLVAVRRRAGGPDED